MCPGKDNSYVGRADFSVPFFLSEIDLCMIYNPVLADRIRGGVTPQKGFPFSSAGTCKVCTSSLELQQPSCDHRENWPKGKCDMLRMAEWKAEINFDS